MAIRYVPIEMSGLSHNVFAARAKENFFLKNFPDLNQQNINK